MIVMKFGGTSVGRPGNFATVIRLVRERSAAGPVVVVVSALQGVTNELVAFASGPSRRDEIARQVAERHEAFAAEAGAASPSVAERHRRVAIVGSPSAGRGPDGRGSRPNARVRGGDRRRDCGHGARARGRQRGGMERR